MTNGKCHSGIEIYKIKFKMAAPIGMYVYRFYLLACLLLQQHQNLHTYYMFTHGQFHGILKFSKYNSKWAARYVVMKTQTI